MSIEYTACDKKEYLCLIPRTDTYEYFNTSDRPFSLIIELTRELVRDILSKSARESVVDVWRDVSLDVLIFSLNEPEEELGLPFGLLTKCPFEELLMEPTCEFTELFRVKGFSSDVTVNDDKNELSISNALAFLLITAVPELDVLNLKVIPCCPQDLLTNCLRVVVLVLGVEQQSSRINEVSCSVDWKLLSTACSMECGNLNWMPFANVTFAPE